MKRNRNVDLAVIIALLSAGIFTGLQGAENDLTASPKYIYPLIKNHGRFVALPNAAEQPQAGSKVLLDITSDATDGKVIKGLDRAALMLNSFISAGIQLKQVRMAIVLHGSATRAALKHEAYTRHIGKKKNPNINLLSKLREAGVDIFVCGQALAHRQIGLGEVAAEVTVAVSAATVNMNKQAQGYAYIPFM